MSDSDKKADATDPENWPDNYGDYLFRYALTRLRDPRLAEDAVQEAFLAALKSRESFAAKSSEKTWLVGILKNKIMDHFRKSAREFNIDDLGNSFSRDEEDFISGGRDEGNWIVARRPADWMIDGSNRVEVDEFWRFLEYCLSLMPKQLADIFAMREIEGLESRDICNELDISPTNLRVILHRVRKQLRRCLEANWIESDSRKMGKNDENE